MVPPAARRHHPHPAGHGQGLQGTKGTRGRTVLWAGPKASSWGTAGEGVRCPLFPDCPLRQPLRSLAVADACGRGHGLSSPPGSPTWLKPSAEPMTGNWDALGSVSWAGLTPAQREQQALRAKPSSRVLPAHRLGRARRPVSSPRPRGSPRGPLRSGASWPGVADVSPAGRSLPLSLPSHYGVSPTSPTWAPGPGVDMRG